LEVVEMKIAEVEVPTGDGERVKIELIHISRKLFEASNLKDGPWLPDSVRWWGWYWSFTGARGCRDDYPAGPFHDQDEARSDCIETLQSWK
jgi:hypothetical protein